MRILFTLCLLQFSFNCFSQLKAGNFPVTNSDTIFSCKRYDQGCGMVRRHAADINTSKTKVIIRCGSFSNNCDPLLVIDGVPTDYSKGISDIEPSIIDSIWVLKYPTSVTLHGSAAAHGVIIIITKKIKQKAFSIKDLTDSSGVAGATVRFISANKKDSITLIANENGIVSTNKLKHSTSYEILVTSIGYQPFSKFITVINSLHPEIYLDRNTKSCEPVILIPTECRRIGCSFYCQCSGIYCTYISSPKLDTIQKNFVFKVYPTPVQRGGTINLQLNNDGKNKTIRLISLDGKQLMQKPLPTSKGNTVFTISTDSRWAGGIYFVQVICEKGRVLASEKIIIQ